MKADREQRKRIIVGISGASGVIYGIRLLEILRDLDIETHLVMSRAAQITLAMETDFKVADVEALAAYVHSNKDIGASCSSGSFRTLGMIVAPCSIKTLSEIATGVTSGLLSRAADVTLKERRRLVLMLRETPLHIGHIRSMAQATEAGAIICPPRAGVLCPSADAGRNGQSYRGPRPRSLRYRYRARTSMERAARCRP